jgi:hypothetical protein
MNTDHEFVLWAVVFVIGLHVFEEHELDFVGWARMTLGLRFMTWRSFYVANAAVALVSVACAGIGWRAPEVSLIVVAGALALDAFLHIIPTVLTRRFSPGLITAVALYLPVSAWTYWAAEQDGALTARSLVLSSLGGVLLLGFAIGMERLRDRVVDPTKAMT